MTDHRVKVDNGKYTFVAHQGTPCAILRHGEPWIDHVNAPNPIHAMMCELDAARVVVQAARANVKQLNGRDVYPAWAVDALSRHDSLTADREPPSAWCGAETREQAGATTAPAPADPPIDLADLERRATIDAHKLDGLHGDPSKNGGWIGHRDYARALALLIPRLRKAEAATHEAVRAAVFMALAGDGTPELSVDASYKLADRVADFAVGKER